MATIPTTSPFQGKDTPQGSPTVHALSVTASDSTPQCGYLYVGGVGTVYVDTEGGETNVPFVVAAVPYVLPVRVKKVYLTNLTATGLVMLW